MNHFMQDESQSPIDDALMFLDDDIEINVLSASIHITFPFLDNPIAFIEVFLTKSSYL